MSLVADSLSYGVSGKTLIRDFSMVFRRGEMVAVVGNNGSGKSTLLSLLAGCPLPDTGSIRLDDLELSAWKVAALARRRVMLPQAFALNFPYCVADVVKMGGVSGVLQRREDQVLCEVMHWFDIGHLANARWDTLSGGERQRTHLARAVLQVLTGDADEFRYLLLDEPTASLDLKYGHRLMEVLEKLLEAGVCVVLVSHDLALLLNRVDLVVMLESGKVYFQGPPNVALNPEKIGAVFGVGATLLRESASGQVALLTEPLCGNRA